MSRHIHPLRCSRKLASLIVSLLLTAILNLLGCSIPDRAAPIDGNYRVVERVIDGDTLVIDNGERVRLIKWWRLCLIGVDTPEIKHPRKPVSTSAKRLPRLQDAWSKVNVCAWSLIQLMHHGLTRTARNRGARWLMSSWKMACCLMRIIKQGCGFANTRFPFARVEEFRGFEREAREQARGLWASK